MAVGGTYPERSKAVENNATVVVEFRSGATGLLIKRWAAEVSSGGEGVVCEKGSAKLGGCLTWKARDMAESSTFPDAVPDGGCYPQMPKEQRDRGYWGFASKGASIGHWLDCIEDKATPTTAGQVGRAGVEIAEAAYRSAKYGQPVTLPL